MAAFETMPHIGQPGLAGKAIVSCGLVAEMYQVDTLPNTVHLFWSRLYSSDPPMPGDSVESQIFEQFREDLDQGNDRRERLIKVINRPALRVQTNILFKASRDVTNISKKAIFLIHRIVLEDSTDDRALALRAAASGREKLAEANAIFAAMRPELVGDHFWRYQRQVSPGLQVGHPALAPAALLRNTARALRNTSRR